MAHSNEDHSAPATGPHSPNVQLLAQEAARLGETLVAAVRAGQLGFVETLLLPGGPAFQAVRLFGLDLLRLDLRLDDPREEGRLAPYDLQIEPEMALLELGVLSTLPPENDEPRARPHLVRLFGSSLVLSRVPGSEYGWLVEEILPVNAGGQLRPGEASDDRIIAAHQGKAPLPLRREKLDPVEALFLEGMQAADSYNLAELFNAVRMWGDFCHLEELSSAGLDRQSSAAWAAAVEYLINLFDTHKAEPENMAARYEVQPEIVTDRAREIAQTLRATQFDDRYSIHPDPIGHFREVFGELGINPNKDEKTQQALLNSKVFDSIEVPPDDEDFFGPPDSR
ncbi:MAG TPA: hypothetical protein VH186_34850 [Chloroflexia bacterium]|nr:hypothetical protein [Chloroflexia bacterium]